MRTRSIICVTTMSLFNCVSAPWNQFNFTHGMGESELFVSSWSCFHWQMRKCQTWRIWLLELTFQLAPLIEISKTENCSKLSGRIHRNYTPTYYHVSLDDPCPLHRTAYAAWPPICYSHSFVFDIMSTPKQLFNRAPFFIDALIQEEGHWRLLSTAGNY